MIDKKYIELINKEIDNLITKDEKIELHHYLSANESANEYYNELLQTNEYLNHIPDREPSENLKKQILNSIDFNKYPAKTATNSFLKFFSIPKMKIAYTFAAGLMVGIIAFSLISNSSNYVNPNDEFGTIGIENTEAKLIKVIPVNLSNISGNIELKNLKNDFLFNVDLNSSQKIDITITYPSNMELQDFKPGLVNNIELSKGENFIKATNSVFHQYKVLLSQKDTNTSLTHIQIMQLGKIVLDESVLLKR